MPTAEQTQSDQGAGAAGVSRPTIGRQCLVAVTAWLPFARPRYALPVIAPSVILLAGAGDRLFVWLRRRRSAAVTGNFTPALS